MSTAFLFPGQGSQSIGMGRDLYDAYDAARDVFDEVDHALNQKLSAMIFNGDADDLNMTENTQPALMAVSMAIIRIIEQDMGIDWTANVSMAAGHSLGEYSAYAAAKTFSLADTARLLKIRGQAMQKAVPVGKGAMAAIIGMDMDQVNAICDEVSVDDAACSLANDNCPGQIVISGEKGAVEAAAALATENGARKAVMLPVSAPFHCAMMQPAADAMRDALQQVDISMPSVPIYTNVTTQPAETEGEIAGLLVDQVTGQVRWTETINAMINDGATTFVEIGAGKVLTGLIRRINRDANTLTVNGPSDIDALMEIL